MRIGIDSEPPAGIAPNTTAVAPAGTTSAPLYGTSSLEIAGVAENSSHAVSPGTPPSVIVVSPPSRTGEVIEKCRATSGRLLTTPAPMATTGGLAGKPGPPATVQSSAFTGDSVLIPAPPAPPGNEGGTGDAPAPPWKLHPVAMANSEPGRTRRPLPPNPAPPEVVAAPMPPKP